MPKDLSNIILFDIYSSLLTGKQREAFDLYYNGDLSLGEISEMSDVSRQNVMHCIKLTEKKLNDLESKLGLAEKFRLLTKKADVLEELLKKEKLTAEKEIFGAVNDIRSLL